MKFTIFRSNINKALLFLLFSFQFTTFKVQSQTYISYSYLKIIQYSFKFTYSSDSYQYSRPYYSDQNILATRQGRYDYYHDIVSTEYYKLKELTLINESNQATLNVYKNQRLNEIYNAGTTLDLSISSNATNIINYCCEIYSYPSVKNEIKLLQSCNVELDRIKYKDPDNYLYSKRYQSIMKTLDKLKTCGVSEIKSLSWEKTEIEDISNNTSSNSNDSYFKVPNTSYTYRKSQQNIKIDNIIQNGGFTVIYLTVVPSKEYISGWTTNFASNGYIKQNGKTFYLQKAEGIPLSPNKHYFSNLNESLSFKLYFSKSINLMESFDLIEIEGSNSAYNFYDISK